jgi:uncharacterized membrane protein AbrB (regulator of aidB expression)
MSEDTPAPSASQEVAAPRPPRFLISRIAVVLIALMWVVAGVTKVYSLPDFSLLIERHGVLPPEWHALPFIELVIALLLVFVAGSELRKPFGRAVLALSLAGILGFAYYLSLVPDAVLQESGCGCMGPRIASGMDNSVRIIAGIRTGLLIALHLVALIGPVITMRRTRPSRAA